MRLILAYVQNATQSILLNDVAPMERSARGEYIRPLSYVLVAEPPHSPYRSLVCRPKWPEIGKRKNRKIWLMAMNIDLYKWKK